MRQAALKPSYSFELCDVELAQRLRCRPSVSPNCCARGAPGAFGRKRRRRQRLALLQQGKAETQPTGARRRFPSQHSCMRVETSPSVLSIDAQHASLSPHRRTRCRGSFLAERIAAASGRRASFDARMTASVGNCFHFRKRLHRSHSRYREPLTIHAARKGSICRIGRAHSRSLHGSLPLAASQFTVELARL